MIKRLVITEGEIDSLILRQIGIVAVSGTTGASTYKIEWNEHIKRAEEIFICLDNDRAGKKGALEMAAKIKHLNPKIVSLPEDIGIKDINEFFLSGKELSDFEQLLSDAKKYDPNDIDFMDLNISEIPVEFTPAQHFTNDFAAISIRLPIATGVDIEEKWYVITSDKRMYDLIEFINKYHFILRKNPDFDLRWSKESITSYLRGKSSLNIGDTFNKTVDFIKKYISFESECLYAVLALWIWATYFHRAFRSFPYLNVTGLLNTGKSKVLEVCAALSFNGDLLMGSTPAFIIRSINDNSSTLCLDEAEKLKDTSNSEVQTLVYMLNSGYRSGTLIGKLDAVQKGIGWKQKKFDPYGPKIVCGINTIAETLVSRSINITMLPSDDNEIRNRDVDLKDPDIQQLRDKYYLSIMEQHKTVQDIYNNITDKVILGRNWQIWRPLLSIALTVDACNEDENQTIYNTIRDFAIEKIGIASNITEDSQSAIQLLLILRTIMKSENKQEAFYPVTNLKQILTTEYQDEFSWIKEGSFNRYLGPILRKAGVISGASESKVITGKLCRGYTLRLHEIERRLQLLGISID